MAFHYNRLRLISESDPAQAEDLRKSLRSGEDNEAVIALFGMMKDKDGGRKGVVVGNDYYPEEEPASRNIPHIMINHFTKGVMPGALFSERPFWKGDPITFHVQVMERVKPIYMDALKETLADLVNGHLQLGAGAGRGLGYFEGTVEWFEAGTTAKQKESMP